jgi:hypothetical protein
MGKIIVANAVVREPGYIYYIDGSGNLCRAVRAMGNKKGSKKKKATAKKATAKKTPAKKVIKKAVTKKVAVKKAVKKTAKK